MTPGAYNTVPPSRPYGGGPQESEENEADERDEQPEGMDDEELQGFVRSEIEDAEDVAEQLQFERRKATQYYDGEPYGDEEEGRSQVVTRDVRDTVHALLPSLLRVFFGPEHVAEFVPRGPEDVALAEQMTDYVDYVLKCDNPGFMVLYSLFLDALIRNQGVAKIWWSTKEKVGRSEYTGLSEEAAMLLQQEAAAAGAEVQFRPGAAGYDAVVTQRTNAGRVAIEAVPPEEFLISRDARSLDEAKFVGHRCYRTVGELVAMGYRQEELDEVSGVNESRLIAQESYDRVPGRMNNPEWNTSDPTRKLVLYVESYVLVDYDGDGLPELRKICTIGEQYKIAHNEIVPERPFAVLCPLPRPHTVFGDSVAGLVMDLQRIKSAVFRRMLDSLANAVIPRTAIVEGQVNIQDALNTEVGGIVRMKAPGMVQPLVTPFVGREAFPVVEYLDQLKEARTGISKAAAGLDADALQSTTRAAVAATVNAAHQHIETIARIFAETGMKDLMRSVLRLVVRHQDRARMVRLRNRWVEINPADWNTEADISVNLAVGATSVEERLQTLTEVAARQEAVLQQYGPVNPLVTVSQYRNTLAKMLELRGFKDPGRFFNDVPPDWQPPPPEQGQDPQAQGAVLLAQVQVQEIQANIAMRQQELELKRQEMLLRQDLERDKLDAEMRLKARELEMKYQQAVDIAAIRADVDRQRNEMAVMAPQTGGGMNGRDGIASPQGQTGQGTAGAPAPAGGVSQSGGGLPFQMA